MPPLPIWILSGVFILTAVRKIGKVRFKIWQVMGIGALIVLLSGQISPESALTAIEPEVMLFLFGMFVLGQALFESGLLAHLSYLLFRKAKSATALFLFFIGFMAFFSALLMNDTLAVIGTPLALMFASRHQISSKPFLLALAFSVTLGSVFSPVGNPQNLLIAAGSGLKNPFTEFFRYLFLPSLLNLGFLFLLLRLFYPKTFHAKPLVHLKDSLTDEKLAFWSKIGLSLTFAVVFLKILFSVLPGMPFFPLSAMALAGAAPILIGSRQRFSLLKKIDWHTLIFFAALFILMKSVWITGFFQQLIVQMNLNIQDLSVVLILSLTISQFISNVPFVALFLPLILNGPTQQELVFGLASGSTVAGNLFILGAASNVIIVQNAEKHHATFTFWDFSKIGFPLTLINILIYWFFLKFL